MTALPDAIPDAATAIKSAIPFTDVLHRARKPKPGAITPFTAFPCAATQDKSAKITYAKKIVSAASAAMRFAVPSAMSAKITHAKLLVMPPHIRDAAKRKNSAAITPHSFACTAAACLAVSIAPNPASVRSMNSAKNPP